MDTKVSCSKLKNERCSWEASMLYVGNISSENEERLPFYPVSMRSKYLYSTLTKGATREMEGYKITQRDIEQECIFALDCFGEFHPGHSSNPNPATSSPFL